MKLVIKILCWVADVGAACYVGLTVAKSISNLIPLVTSVPVIGQIPTPVIEPLVEAIY